MANTEPLLCTRTIHEIYTASTRALEGAGCHRVASIKFATKTRYLGGGGLGGDGGGLGGGGFGLSNKVTQLIRELKQP